MMSTPLLEVKDLSVSFYMKNEKVDAVKAVSFTLFPNETLALIGESGSGKSTLAHTLIHLFADNAKMHSGKILLNGDDLTKKTKREWQKIRGKEIGMVFQDALTSLNPLMKVGAQICEAIRCHQKVTKNAAKTRALELLSLVGFADPERQFHHYPFELSGGMRQRVVLAIALSNSPSLLILDEATTALDVLTQAKLLKLLKEIQRTEQTAFLMITHDLAVATAFADTILVMHQGKVVERGSTQKMISDPKESYTQDLMALI